MPRSPRRPAPTGASRRTAPRLEAMSFPHQRPRRLRQSAALRRLVEEWNATRIGPKAYLTIADGGVVRLHGEVTYPLEAGMTDAQLEDFVFTGCRLIVAFMREAEEFFPDPLRGSLEP